jgi:hypothetical protein
MLNDSIAAVCAYFNPCHYPSRPANHRRFREAVSASGIRLLTVELAFGDDPLELSDGEVLGIRGGDIMWQKERLLQLGAEKLVGDGVEKVVLLDCDIAFDHHDWPTLVSRALDNYPVVQCFSTVEMNYSDTTLRRDGAVRAWLEEKRVEGSAKGFAWGLRAEIIREVGLYQHCVVGGGDSALCMAALGLAGTPDAWDETLHRQHFIRLAGDVMVRHYVDWARRFRDLTGDEVGFVEGVLSTFPHGALARRHYNDRHCMLSGFDPRNDVTGDDGGAFMWTKAGECRREAVKRYFRQRDEG